MKKIKEVTFIDIATILVVVGFFAWIILEACHGT